MRNTMLMALGLLAAVSAARAETTMYRWVDAQGTVHYSQNPPPQGRFDAVRPPAAVPAPAPTAPAPESINSQFLQQYEKQQAEAAARKREAQTVKAQAQQRCSLARQQLTVLNSGPPNRFAMVNEDGSYSRMPTEEWQRRREEAAEAVARECNR